MYQEKIKDRTYSIEHLNMLIEIHVERESKEISTIKKDNNKDQYERKWNRYIETFLE